MGRKHCLCMPRDCTFQHTCFPWTQVLRRHLINHKTITDWALQVSTDQARKPEPNETGILYDQRALTPHNPLANYFLLCTSVKCLSSFLIIIPTKNFSSCRNPIDANVEAQLCQNAVLHLLARGEFIWHGFIEMPSSSKWALFLSNFIFSCVTWQKFRNLTALILQM